MHVRFELVDEFVVVLAKRMCRLCAACFNVIRVSSSSTFSLYICVYDLSLYIDVWMC